MLSQLTPPPAAPSRATPLTFSALLDAFLAWIVIFVGEMNALIIELFGYSTTATTGAATATAQAAIATAGALTVTNALNASRWVSGTNYAQDQCVWSPLDYCIYQRKTAGAGATDPANDPANWATRSNFKMLLSTVTVTSFTWNSDGTMASMTYATGNKEVFTYVAGKLSTCKYYGTDGVTLLRTETITYTGSQILADTWS
jgi:hypothetical protein